MDVIEIQTLIDITETRVTRSSQGSQLEIDQNRNFITLKQCVELRSIVGYDQKPKYEMVDLKNLGFGSNFKGQHLVWSFTFSPDRAGIYRDEHGNPTGLLIEDIHGVPIIKNLTETINIDKAIFELKDVKARNTIIKALPGTV